MPLTQADRLKGAKAGGLARNKQRMAAVAKATEIWAVVDELGDVSPAALRVALGIIRQIELEGAQLPIEDWLDAQRATGIAVELHKLHRLASGQSTANVAHAAMSEEERKERMSYLRSLAGQTTQVADTMPNTEPSPPL